MNPDTFTNWWVNNIGLIWDRSIFWSTFYPTLTGDTRKIYHNVFTKKVLDLIGNDF